MFQHVIEIPQTQEDYPIWDQQLRVAAYCRKKKVGVTPGICRFPLSF